MRIAGGIYITIVGTFLFAIVAGPFYSAIPQSEIILILLLVQLAAGFALIASALRGHA